MFSYLFDNEIFAYRVPEMEQCSLPHKLCSTIPTIPICRYEGLQSEAVRFISYERYLPRASDIERLIQCHLWSQNSEGLQGGEDWREWQIERAVKGRETYSRWSLVRAFEDLLFWDHPFRKIECMNGVHLIKFCFEVILICEGKYHCATELQFDLIGFYQTRNVTNQSESKCCCKYCCKDSNIFLGRKYLVVQP